MNGSGNRAQAGFTLVEAIMVIVITGIIAGMVAVFIKPPIDAYFDTARRAELTDIADTATRRIARDLQGALPNSVRVDATGQFLEFIPILDAGRYRAEAGVAVADDPLDFTLADTSFDVLGPPVAVAAGASLVVYNLGIPGASAYEMPLSNRRLATAGGATVAFTAVAGTPLPLPSPGSRFQIVGTPVSYVCTAGSLLRYAGYGFPSPSTVTATTAFGAAVPAVLATNVNNAVAGSGCNFTYGAGPLQRSGLVSIFLTLAQGGETVTLQHQVNVDNTP